MSHGWRVLQFADTQVSGAGYADLLTAGANGLSPAEATPETVWTTRLDEMRQGDRLRRVAGRR